MKINELKNRMLELKKYKFPRHDYEVYVQYPFDSKYLDEGLYITQKEGYWEVFSCDRGYIYVIGKFETEDDACEYFFCCCKQGSDNNRWF